MLYLITASLLWSFSFGLIKEYLADQNPFLVTAIRLFLSLVIFLPLLKPGKIGLRLKLRLMAIGAVQYGVMYMTYQLSYWYLEGHVVALFTILTPLYVTFFNDLFTRRVHSLFWGTATLAAIGAAVIVYTGKETNVVLLGFLLVQLSNLCFAIGQIDYRRVIVQSVIRGRDVFGWLYLGGALVSILPAAFLVEWRNVSLGMDDILVLLYLGTVPAGIGFFLWNTGAARVNAGTLAVLNNLKVPLAVTATILLFGERVDLRALVVGGGLLLLAVIINEVKVRRYRTT